MTKSTDKKEKTVKVTYQIPQDLADQIVSRTAALMKKRKVTVSKTEVAVELMELGLQSVK